MQLISFLALFIVLLSACTSQVIIDNPTNSTLQITLDQKNITLDAKRSKTINLKNKEVKLIVKDTTGIEIVDEMINISGNGILNPTRSLYIIQKDIYCSVEDYEKYKLKLNLKKIITVNDKEYENVDFLLQEALFIPKNWDYGLDSDFPKNITSSDFQIVSKIYRLDALEKSFGYMGEIDFSNYTQKEMDVLLDSLNNMSKDSL
ncbi:MAG: hypothetical protein ACPGVH_04485 [Chitinophagales bacterium]